MGVPNVEMDGFQGLVIELKGFCGKLLHSQRKVKNEKFYLLCVFVANRYNEDVRMDHRNILGFWSTSDFDLVFAGKISVCR